MKFIFNEPPKRYVLGVREAGRRGGKKGEGEKRQAGRMEGNKGWERGLRLM